jgi:hypothetical protein
MQEVKTQEEQLDRKVCTIASSNWIKLHYGHTTPLVCPMSIIHS